MRLRTKLFLIIIALSVVIVTAMLGFARWSVERAFVDFVETRRAARVERIAGRIESHYERHGSFDALAADTQVWLELLYSARRTAQRRNDVDGPKLPRFARRMVRSLGPVAPTAWPPEEIVRRLERDGRPLPLELRVMLLDSEGKLIRGQERWVRDAAKTPLVVADATVGYIAIAPGPTLADLGEINFLERQHGTLALIAIAIFVGAALLAYMLAGRLTRPIGRLRAVTHQLTQGDYEARTQLLRDDEIGALAADVDGLAATLEKHERDRRQWIADIAHELRTPLAVMRAQLEAVEDGVRPLSNSLITSLHGDVERLSRLVNDLHELTVTDLGKMSFNLVPLRLGELLHNELNECLPAESTDGIDASFDLAAVGDVHILGDAGRISQLVRNLVNNTLRYTDRPGKLRVTARRTEENIYITFDDSAPGVPEASFAHLFERLYRVDPSRNRDTGGAGLGLAICRNIVDAHQGSITASASPLGGLRIEITFPLEPDR